MKRLFSLFFVLLLAMSLTVTAFASGNTRTGEVTSGDIAIPSITQSGGGIDLMDPNGTQSYVDNELFGQSGLINGSVTTETIVGKLNAKGNDVVTILQTVGKYVCIAGFVICCILTLVGIIGNKRLLAGAIIGLLISGLAYAGIVCGREIVNWIATWAVS